jgi:meso-butanediol dehydrogenase / (S,S)-butanediol dehydrogenase / diacetyl reductase
VTGGANGIGLAIAEVLAESGASVWIFDLANEEPEAAAARIGAQGVVADVTDLASLETAFARLPRIDVLAANAGAVRFTPLTETAAADWNHVLAVNLTGMFHTVRLAALRMKLQRSGAMVLTASTNSYDGEATLAAYNASKAGVLGLMRTAANELGAWGIRVNAICPGLIRTRLTAPYFDQPEVLEPYFQAIALGRGGEPREVAQAAAFLASDLASYITGAALLVDGGQMASKFSVWNEETARFAGDRWELI